MLGVMTVGVLPGVLIAVALALLKVLLLTSHPLEVVLRPVEGPDGVPQTTKNEDEDGIITGLIIYRFDSPLLFFNADYFKDRVRSVIEHEHSKPRRFLFDAEAVSLLDVTGADGLEALHAELATQGIHLEVARAKGLFRLMLERSGVAELIGQAHIFPTVHAGIQAFIQASPPNADNRRAVALAAAERGQ